MRRIRRRLFRASLVSAPLTPELSKLVAMANKMVRQVKRDFYSLGLVWNGLADETDERTAAAIWEQYVDPGVSVREAQNYGLLAREFSAETVTSKPLSRLLLCSRYCHERNVPVPKDPSSLVIEWTEDGQPMRRRFDDCRTEQLQTAVDQLRPPRPPHSGDKQKSEPPIPDDYKKIWQYLQDQLHDTLVQDPDAVFEMHMVAERKARVRIEVEEEILVDLAEGIVEAAQAYASQQGAPKRAVSSPRRRKQTRKARSRGR